MENMETKDNIDDSNTKLKDENKVLNVDTNNVTSKESKNIEEPAQLTKKQEFLNFVKFTLFSISAGVIQIVSFTILNEIIFKDSANPYGWSYFISLVLSVLWNFTFNKKFTFKSAKNVPIAMLLVFAYYCVFTPLSIWWGVALTNAHWNEYLVEALTMIVNMLTEFLWTRYVVYRGSINTATPKEKLK